MTSHPGPTELDSARQLNLSRKQQRVYDFLLNNQVAVANLTLEELAVQLNVSVSTIIRLSKELGYEGFGELKREMRQDFLRTLAPLEQFVDRSTSTVDPDLVTAQLQQDWKNLAELIERTSTNDIVGFAQRIVAARRTLIVSTGSYGTIGELLAHHCKFMGYDVQFEERGTSFLAHAVANLTTGDLLVTIAFWRDAQPLVTAVESARRDNIQTVTISDSRKLRVAAHSDLVLVAPSESTAFYQSMVAGVALVYATINAVWQLNQTKAERSAARAQALYPALGILAPEKAAD